MTPEEFLAKHGGVNRFRNEQGQLTLNKLRPVEGVHQNGLLRDGEWERIDAAAMRPFQINDYGFPDLIAEGLTKNLGGLGALFSGYDAVSDMEGADMSMDGKSDGTKDSIEYDPRFTPVPMTFKKFDIGLRKLEAARLTGSDISVDSAYAAGLSVRDKLRYTFFNGWGSNVGGRYLYGLTNQPNRLTDTALNFGGGDFGTGGNAYKTFLGVLNSFSNLGIEGQFGFWVSSPQYLQMLSLYGNGDLNELQLILKNIPEIKWIKKATTTDLAAGAVVGCLLDPSAVEVGTALEVQTIQWDKEIDMETEFRVTAAKILEIKEDFENVVATVHVTAA